MAASNRIRGVFLALLSTATVGAQEKPTVEFFDGVHARLVPPKPSGGGDPIWPIVEQMDAITHELGARKTDDPTQQQQKLVLSQLDAVIMQLEEQCKNGSGSSRNPSKPLADSKIVAGPGGMGELIAPKADRKTIANLPTKERDRIQQSKTEGFPSGYESLLSSYYTRLAQEKVTSEDSADKPTTRPNGQESGVGPLR